MQALRSARTSKEFRRVLEEIVSIATSVKIPKDIESLSAKAIELSDLDSAPRRVVTKLNLATTIDLSKIDITNVREKAKYNDQISTLTQSIAELGIAYQILNSRMFSAFKDQEQASAKLVNVIKAAKEQQATLIKLMSIDVKTGTPTEHKKLAAVVANYMSKILNKEQYSKIVSRTFIAKGSDPLVFQTFVHIEDFVNTEGTHYPQYYLVLSTEVALGTGAAQHYITTLVDDKVPGSFPMGRVIKSGPELKKALNTLLAVDGFLNYGEKVPLRRTTEQLRQTTMLGSTTHQIRGRSAEIIDSIRIQNDFLYVKLVPGLTPREKRDAIQEVLAMATATLRGKGKAGLMYQMEKGRGGAEYIKVALTSSEGQSKGVITVAKINQLAESLGLTKEQTRMLKQTVK